MEYARYAPEFFLFSDKNLQALFPIALGMATTNTPEPIHPSQRTEKAIAAVMLLVLLLTACSIGYAPVPGETPTPTSNGCPDFAGYKAQRDEIEADLCTLDINKTLSGEAPIGYETKYVPNKHHDVYIRAQEGESIEGEEFKFRKKNQNNGNQ